MALLYLSRAFFFMYGAKLISDDQEVSYCPDPPISVRGGGGVDIAACHF